MANISNLKPVKKGQRTKEEQKKFATMGGYASGIARKRNKTLKEIFKSVGGTTSPKSIQDQLKRLGYDVDDLTLIDAIVKILSARTLDKKASIADMMKFIELFAKYTGQEPAQEINLGVNIEVADKKAKKEIEDLWND